MEITVFSTKTCPWCRKVEEFLDGMGVQYTKKDITGDRAAAMEIVKKTRQMGVPVTKIGEKYIVGYDPEAIKEALGTTDN